MMPTLKHLITSLTIVLFVPLVHATTQAPDARNDYVTWIGVVTTDETNIRCGANESYYPIAKASAGDLVRVHGKRQDWIRIETSGSVFNNSIGYVKYPADNSAAFSTDGAIGTSGGESEVLAKRIDSEELYRSWCGVYQMHEGETITVIDSMVTEPGTLHLAAYVVHTVQMPSGGTGWINASHITRATDEQAATFNQWPSVATEGDTAQASQENEIIGALDENDSVNTEDFDDSEALSIAELEAAWNKIASEGRMGAEVAPLRDLYAELLEDNKGDLVIARISNGRIKQLDVWAELQEQRVRIEKLRAKVAATSEEVSESQTVMSMFGDFELVGRLTLSNTFDGRLRQFMYRIQEQTSGRTLGYVRTSKGLDLASVLGHTVGIMGTKSWNPNWRVNVVHADGYHLFPPTTATAEPHIQ
jgi:hypothetical protein